MRAFLIIVTAVVVYLLFWGGPFISVLFKVVFEPLHFSQIMASDAEVSCG